MLSALATCPRVHVRTSARDATGRPAVELSRTDTSGLPDDKSDGQTYATYESPTTGAVLESTITYPPGSDIVTPQDPHGTSTVIDSTVYLSVTWASAVPADPYGADSVSGHSRERTGASAGIARGTVWSVRPVGMCLVECRDGLFRDGAVGADLETVAGRPFPYLGCAGLPAGTGDLGARLPGPGDPDGLGDEVGGAPCPFHGELGEHGAGELIDGAAGSSAFECLHGLGEFFQAEGADRVVEQAVLGA